MLGRSSCKLCLCHLDPHYTPTRGVTKTDRKLGLASSCSHQHHHSDSPPCWQWLQVPAAGVFSEPASVHPGLLGDDSQPGSTPSSDMWVPALWSLSLRLLSVNTSNLFPLFSPPPGVVVVSWSYVCVSSRCPFHISVLQHLVNNSLC